MPQGAKLESGHFRLVLATPNAKLVAGLRRFLSVHTLRFNHRNKQALNADYSLKLCPLIGAPSAGAKRSAPGAVIGQISNASLNRAAAWSIQKGL